jgi:hypothetical protein
MGQVLLLALSRKRLFDFGRHVGLVQGRVGCCWGDSELVRVDVRVAMTQRTGRRRPHISLAIFLDYRPTLHVAYPTS